MALVAVVNGGGGVVGDVEEEAKEEDEDDDEEAEEEEEAVALDFLPVLLALPRLGLPIFRARRFAARFSLRRTRSNASL
jgi:hypothetical protein